MTTTSHYHGALVGFYGAAYGLVFALSSGYRARAQNHTDGNPTRLSTAAHKLGHVFCGHLGAVKDRFWPDNSKAAKNVREFEAEAVAYLVTHCFNLDIGSHTYLADYLSDASKPLPDFSLDTVLKGTGKIEEMLRSTFRVRRSPRVKAAVNNPANVP